MCGIVGAVAERNVVPILLAGLERLEYRGYDSAGVAVLNQQGIEICRRVGKVAELRSALANDHLQGQIGIAHTRWATHGKPSEQNAHPHHSKQSIAIVHNGIIENYQELKVKLQAAGYDFQSETDTEVVAHLLHQQFSITQDMLQAIQATVAKLSGAYALGIINQAEPDTLYAVRQGSPLIIGVGVEESFIASDHLALLPVTQQFIFLQEGDIAKLTKNEQHIFSKDDARVERPITTSALSDQKADKGEYRHYMLKEIYEQPLAIQKTLTGRLLDNQVDIASFGEAAARQFKSIKRIQIIACGTSYHAGLVGRYWLEALAGIPCQVEIASEYRYRDAVLEPNTLFITLSQSGETADTLSALRKAKQQTDLISLSICNVPESALVRESDLVLLTKAGPEIGVASTKAFTTQLVALLLLTAALTRNNNTEQIVQVLRTVANHVEAALQLDSPIKKLSEYFANKHHTLFLGRGIQYPIALEGALKLKEISYIHAEAYPAGELKHGPLALVDEDMPVVAIAPNDHLLEKLLANLQEVKARGGELIVFADQALGITAEENTKILKVPTVDAIIAPIVYTIPMQLLAYHVAVIKGTDVDQPRNLAKSVTVE